MAEALCALKLRAKQTGIPAIYANDNFGRWRSDFPKLVQYCLGEGIRGNLIARRLAPEPDDYFILQAETLRFLPDQSGYSAEISRCSHGDRHGNRRRHLRAIYRQRCLYEGSSCSGTAGLHRLRGSRAEPTSPYSYATSAQGQY